MNESVSSSRKSKKNIFVVVIALVLLIFFGAFLWGRNWYYDLDRLPRGTVLEQEKSPDNTYTIVAYLSDGGATTSLSVLCELKFNDGKNKSKTIYFQNDIDEVSINWIDESEVNINGHVLHVPEDIYDYRKQ